MRDGEKRREVKGLFASFPITSLSFIPFLITHDGTVKDVTERGMEWREEFLELDCGRETS